MKTTVLLIISCLLLGVSAIKAQYQTPKLNYTCKLDSTVVDGKVSYVVKVSIEDDKGPYDISIFKRNKENKYEIINSKKNLQNGNYIFEVKFNKVLLVSIDFNKETVINIFR